MSTPRLPLGAYARGPNAVITWRDCREVLQERLRKLECDRWTNPALVRGFRAWVSDLEAAALAAQDWDRARSATESAEVPGNALETRLERPPRLDTKAVAVILDCEVRWVTQLCVTGRLSAVKRGRMWEIDPDSVEDFKIKEGIPA
jgi:hypothetical protein